MFHPMCVLADSYARWPAICHIDEVGGGQAVTPLVSFQRDSTLAGKASLTEGTVTGPGVPRVQMGQEPILVLAWE